MATVSKVISSGTLGAGSASALGAQENKLPEGTQMELVLTAKAITVPAGALIALGGIAGAAVALLGDITGPRLVSGSASASGLASLVNALGSSGGPFAGVKRWAGQALAVSSGSQVRIRWVKEAAASQLIIAGLAGLTAAAAAFTLGYGTPVIIAAAIAVAGLFFLAYPLYQLLAWVVQKVQQIIHGIGASPVGSVGLDIALVGGGLFALVLIVKGVSHHGG